MSISRNTQKIFSFILAVFLLGMFVSTPLAYAQATPSNTDIIERHQEGQSISVQIGVWIMQLGALITGVGGSLLDNSLDFFVIKLASTLGDPNDKSMGAVIESSWKTIRDVSNIVFIFGFIYIGIATILNPSSSRIKGLIAQLVIAAVLINFSLFFVKALIDVSNFFAHQTLTLFGGNESNIDLAYAFTNAMGLQTLYETSNSSIAAFTSGGSIAFFIAGTLFLVIAGFVFAAAAVLLAVRFVALILFMIFSPFLFVGAVFTSMRSWWMMLISYAIYPPVFLFLMYLSIRILSASSWHTDSESLAILLSSGATRTDGFTVILQFTVAVIFLLISLKAADKLGIAGSKATIDFGNKLRGYGQRAVTRGTGAAVFGLGAAGLRNTAGAYGARKSEEWQDAASKSGFRGTLARAGIKASRVAADSSFDARKVGGVGKKLGLGEGRKGGYKTAREDIKKKEDKFAKSLGTVSDSDTEVQKWQSQIDDTEMQIQLLTEEKNALPKGQQRELKGRIDALKFQKANYLEAKEYEKNRRQIGTASANARMGSMSAAQRAELHKAFKDVAQTTSPVDRKAAMDTLAKTKKRIQEELKNKQPDVSERGYAGVLESSYLGALMKGRGPKKEQYAAKEIRKGIEKGLKKGKDDKQTDRIVEALNKKE